MRRLSLCFVLSVMDGKIKQDVCIKLCVKLGNLLPKPLKCFVRLLENILQAGEWILNGFQVSRMVRGQLTMTNVHCDRAPAKPKKIFKKFGNSSANTIAKQSMSVQPPLK
jgi:hypothetical protein